MKRVLACLAASLCAACAGGPEFMRAPGRPLAAQAPGGQVLTPEAAVDRLAIGLSSKTEVMAALGQAVVIAFDSGKEVWVYRWAGEERTTRAATELVLLFDAGGTLVKLRLRPGYS